MEPLEPTKQTAQRLSHPSLYETLSKYEDAWRKAALEDRRQFFTSICAGKPIASVGTSGQETCARLVLSETGLSRILLPGTWHCPHDTWSTNYLSNFLIHLNNAHHWTWDQLANKTRDILEEGMRSPVEPHST